MEPLTNRQAKKERVSQGSFRQALRCGLRRRCPNCGKGPMFGRWFKVLEACPFCRLSYWPESGYYVGAMYLTFIASFFFITPIFVAVLLLDPGLASVAAWKMAAVWAVCCLPLPLALVPFSYGIWLSLDFWLNPWEAGKPPELLSR